MPLGGLRTAWAGRLGLAELLYYTGVLTNRLVMTTPLCGVSPAQYHNLLKCIMGVALSEPPWLLCSFDEDSRSLACVILLNLHGNSSKGLCSPVDHV